MMHCKTQGHTKIGVSFVYAPYVHGKMVAYQNVTPDLMNLLKFEILKDVH